MILQVRLLQAVAAFGKGVPESVFWKQCDENCRLGQHLFGVQ
jgi:hypothetical protein